MRLALLLLLLLLVSGAGAQELWFDLDREVEQAILSSEMPGAVLLVGKGDEILYCRAYGEKSAGVMMNRDALFDAASLTKPLVTAIAVLQLADQGKIDLKAPLSDELPVTWKPVPSIKQLLTHHSGLPPGLRTEDFPDKLFEVSPDHPPGSGFVYSDVGYLLLGKLVEAKSGLSLDEYFERYIAEPLGLVDSTFHPDPTRSVPTFGVDPGTVHDPRSRKVNGIAGHAGLFVSADDVHRLLANLPEILSPESLNLYWEQQEGGRTLGLDSETRFSTPRGSRFSPRTSAGHTGFTGTSFWWDRPSGLHVVLLASRLHPDNEGTVVALRGALSTLVAEYFLGAQIKTGLDQLVASDFEPLKGKRVGWILNHTSRDRTGRHTLELLPVKPGFELSALLTPEHGLEGVRDEKIEHGFHSELGVPIYSLYGETRRPKKEWFESFDVVVFDLQDVGVRYYTYISTLKYCLEMAEQTRTTVLVLDRPNPLGGETVDGHLATEFSFICCDRLPLVHGMTVGEVALFLNRDIGARLVVEKMEGWRREMTWEATGLPFLSPSPNLAELEAVDLYPVLGQLEWGELSVGRGTKSPFRVIGAPYIKDPLGLAQELQQAMKDQPLTFRARQFVPQSSKFEGQVCGGVEVGTTGPLLRPAMAGLKMAQVLAKRYPEKFHLKDMARHLGTWDVESLTRAEPQVVEWRNIRKPYLLYP